MPNLCECEGHGCGTRGGVQIDQRTFRKHQQKDKLVQLQKGQAESERAVQEELDRISRYMERITLDDRPSNDLPSVPSPERQPPDRKSDPFYNPSRQETIRNLLSQLSEIETATSMLEEKFVSALDDFNKLPHQVSTTFPLKHIQIEHLNLWRNLEKIHFHASPVQTMKESISRKLSDIQERFKQVKTVWRKRQQVAEAKSEAEHGLGYSTGMKIILSLMRYPNLPIRLVFAEVTSKS